MVEKTNELQKKYHHSIVYSSLYCNIPSMYYYNIIYNILVCDDTFFMKIKMLHQVNDGATRLFIQSSCFVGSFARCDPNKTVYIFLYCGFVHTS